jgi:hypothetical protein
MAGSSEHGNEPSGPIKVWEFLVCRERLSAFEGGSCSLESVF